MVTNVWISQIPIINRHATEHTILNTITSRMLWPPKLDTRSCFLIIWMGLANHWPKKTKVKIICEGANITVRLIDQSIVWKFYSTEQLSLTGNSSSNVSQAACLTGRVGYIGPPGAVKEYSAVFNRVLVVARNSTPIESWDKKYQLLGSTHCMITAYLNPWENDVCIYHMFHFIPLRAFMLFR